MKKKRKVATEGGARTRPAISYRSSQNQIADEYEQLDKARLMVRLIECRFLRSNPRPEQGGFLPGRAQSQFFRATDEDRSPLRRADLVLTG